MRRAPFAAAAVAVALGIPASAGASPVVDPFLGGTVFTGPTRPNAAAFYYNPAAIALDPGTHLYVSGNVRLDQITIDRSSIDPATGVPGGSRSIPNVSDNLLTPGGLIGVYSDFRGSRVTLGFGIYSPHVERFIPDQEALGYHTSGGHAFDLFYTPTVAFRINSKFVIGFGVSVVSSSLRLEFSRDTALEAGSAGLSSDCDGEPCGAENPQAAQSYAVAVDSFLNVSFNVGGTFEHKSGWVVGAGVTSPPAAFGTLEVESPGEVTVTRAPRDGGGEISGDARVIYELPWGFHAGVRGPLADPYEVVVDASYLLLGRQRTYDLRMFGGDLPDQNVPNWYPRFRGLEDVLVVSAGVEGREHERVRLGARARFETAAVTSENLSPMAIARWNLGVAAGAELRPTRELALSIGYAFSWFPTGSADPSAYSPASRIDCVDGGFELEACDPSSEGLGIPTAQGDYDRLQHALSLGVRYDWF